MKRFKMRLRRTLRDYRRIWKPDHRSRLTHLWRCWCASERLIIVLKDGTLKEIP